MKKAQSVSYLLTMIVVVILMTFNGCKKENPPSRSISYDLEGKDVLGISGIVTFKESSSTSVIIDITLVNAPDGIYPANLYMNSLVESGAVSIALNPVYSNGKSSTTISTMNYEALIAYDGCIKIISSNNEPIVVLAQCDIGGNEITEIRKSYALNLVGVYGVSGFALFEKRVNGNTLLTITLTGMIPGDTYPATINLGSIASVGGGPVVKLLNNVRGTTGKSYTNIQRLDNGINITYENWLVYDGYLNVYQPPIALENIICQGNIGSN